MSSLTELTARQAKLSTIDVDPPWPYSNTAARGAAENHYRTLTIDRIRDDPVQELVADQAHRHLWTTNAFLRDAVDMIHHWGFRYRSCLVARRLESCNS